MWYFFMLGFIPRQFNQQIFFLCTNSLNLFFVLEGKILLINKFDFYFRVLDEFCNNSFFSKIRFFCSFEIPLSALFK